MSVTAIHAWFRRRRRVAAVAVMLVLGAAVAAAHSAPMEDHVGGGAAMCLAIVAIAGVAAVAATPDLGRLRYTHLRSSTPFSVRVVLRRPVPLARSRAGPELQVFLL